MRLTTCPAILLVLGMTLSGARAQGHEQDHDQAPTVVDKYNITPIEKAACESDANSLCSDAYPDEDRLIVCMKENLTKLTPICSKVFQAGLKKRHLQ